MCWRIRLIKEDIFQWSLLTDCSLGCYQKSLIHVCVRQSVCPILDLWGTKKPPRWLSVGRIWISPLGNDEGDSAAIPIRWWAACPLESGAPVRQRVLKDLSQAQGHQLMPNRVQEQNWLQHLQLSISEKRGGR